MEVKVALTAFCNADCDRYSFLVKYLREKSIPFSVLETFSSRHIIIRFDSAMYLRKYRIKTLTAHYDRVTGTPGANDNGAAVFQLLLFAERLSKRKKPHNIQIIFTDDEESPENGKIENLGAFRLGSVFREKKIDNLLFIVFDMCGRGDTVIYSNSGKRMLMEKKGKDNSVYTKIKDVEPFITSFLLSVNNGFYITASAPFSDDIGFILNGFPAFQFSLLPWEEAVKFKNNSEAGNLKMDKEVFKSIMPVSWKPQHTANDTVETLEESAFTIISEILDGLVICNIPVNRSSGVKKNV